MIIPHIYTTLLVKPHYTVVFWVEASNIAPHAFAKPFERSPTNYGIE